MTEQLSLFSLLEFNESRKHGQLLRIYLSNIKYLRGICSFLVALSPKCVVRLNATRTCYAPIFFAAWWNHCGLGQPPATGPMHRRYSRSNRSLPVSCFLAALHFVSWKRSFDHREMGQTGTSRSLRCCLMSQMRT
jgi:hypothetical protein